MSSFLGRKFNEIMGSVAEEAPLADPETLVVHEPAPLEAVEPQLAEPELAVPEAIELEVVAAPEPEPETVNWALAFASVRDSAIFVNPYLLTVLRRYKHIEGFDNTLAKVFLEEQERKTLLTHKED